MSRNYDKQINWIEKYSIILIITSITIFLVLNKYQISINSKYAFYDFYNYLTGPLKLSLTKKDGTLITIATVFIGIYFTVFTLLSSIKIDSTFAILTEKNFDKLLKFIRNAFIGSFVYLFYSLISSSIESTWISSYITIILLLFMLLSALRFGIIIYFIFNRDVKTYYKQLKVEKEKRLEIDNLYKRLDSFLNDQENKKLTEHSLKLSEQLERKQKKT
ncbi:hypothetical protein ACQCVB_19790 [Fictibacillus phosphorivorans]|uniref:hypothetical protein n=1 Tax=Fictibacillus phosphorivorans TaxID=1221500 RepID=UPI003CF5FA9E